MAVPDGSVPWGISLLNWIGMKWWPHRRMNKLAWHRGGVLALTYLAYTCYHMSRKPISVVKTVLYQNCSGLSPPPDIPIDDNNRDTWCDWAPFDTPDAPTLLGTMDSAFLFAYAAAMFLSGFVAERVDLRYFLSLGMLFSGISCYAFGLAKVLNIHSPWYFFFIQAAGGVFQTSGWPGVVTVVGNWFGKGKRGLIFGIWNSHTSLGNILGSLIAGGYVETDWSNSFIVPGILIGIAGFIIFLFLSPNPKIVGCSIPGKKIVRKIYVEGSSEDDNETQQIDNEIEESSARSETSPMLSVNRRCQDSSDEQAIGFIGAIKIPGVMEYSLSLFFAKLVSYTFLYWLPLYITSATTYNAALSADLSTLFDVGGIIGAIAAGLLSDYSGMSAVTCATMLIAAIPMLFIYVTFGSIYFMGNVILLIIVGVFVNGPYALITTAVSAELGTHPSLGDNSKALATVTAIIDGTGSIGAAVGPLLAGFMSRWMGWHSVFYMLMVSDLFALLFLSRLVYRDLKMYRQRRLAV
ncbi:glucose-6-phosphate exchanger SLC37A2 isoform X2 [Aphidius gifuensis]|uniref:glucose-6-phosphate exchanger SLC37A2 isoform X2 n=1 Tax=Aphidius gifuensis TaxID=684658 RepID=UPI001CDC3172|nr:glucose-6-phosphate exchanger SLC37A2 isoform X2 [Aphidius gifuensis]